MRSRGITTAVHLDIIHCLIQKQPLWKSAVLCNSNVVDLCSEGHGSNTRRYTMLHSSYQFHEARSRLRHKKFLSRTFPTSPSLIHHSPYRSMLYIPRSRVQYLTKKHSKTKKWSKSRFRTRSIILTPSAMLRSVDC